MIENKEKFLKQLELELKDRYTALDDDYNQVAKVEFTNPPIVKLVSWKNRSYYQQNRFADNNRFKHNRSYANNNNNHRPNNSYRYNPMQRNSNYNNNYQNNRNGYNWNCWWLSTRRITIPHIHFQKQFVLHLSNFFCWIFCWIRELI